MSQETMAPTSYDRQTSAGAPASRGYSCSDVAVSGIVRNIAGFQIPVGPTKKNARVFELETPIESASRHLGAERATQLSEMAERGQPEPNVVLRTAAQASAGLGTHASTRGRRPGSESGISVPVQSRASGVGPSTL
jgi:hypothetical protein